MISKSISEKKCYLRALFLCLYLFTLHQTLSAQTIQKIQEVHANQGNLGAKFSFGIGFFNGQHSTPLPIKRFPVDSRFTLGVTIGFPLSSNVEFHLKPSYIIEGFNSILFSKWNILLQKISIPIGFNLFMSNRFATTVGVIIQWESSGYLIPVRTVGHSSGRETSLRDGDLTRPGYGGFFGFSYFIPTKDKGRVGHSFLFIVARSGLNLIFTGVEYELQISTFF